MQPYHSNLLRPCKVIDHQEDLRCLVQECGALPSYTGAEQIVENREVMDFLDRYSEEYARIADRTWAGPDYQSGRSCVAQFLGRVNVDKFFGDRMERAHRITREKEAKKDEPEDEEDDEDDDDEWEDDEDDDDEWEDDEDDDDEWEDDDEED